MPSYVLAPDGTSILCARCGSISYNANDVAFHYCSNCHRFHDDVQTIEMWVIYDHPNDYPDSYVLRRRVMAFVPGLQPYEFVDETCRVGDLAELRTFIRRGAVNLGRSPEDDAKILEVWII